MALGMPESTERYLGNDRDCVAMRERTECRLDESENLAKITAVSVATSPNLSTPLPATLRLPGTVRVGMVETPVRRLASGHERLDAALGGGLPRGRLTEITGPATAGKTSVLLAFLAAATQRSEVTALVDVADAFDPRTAHGAGVELARLLWVRPPSLAVGLRCAELLLEAGGFGVIAVDLGAPSPWQLRMPVWPRLVRAAKRADVALAVAAPRRVAGSFAALSLTCAVSGYQWSQGAWPLFDGIRLQLTVARNKLGAPGRSAHLNALTANAAPDLFPAPPPLPALVTEEGTVSVRLATCDL
jgi:hypothetical protein